LPANLSFLSSSLLAREAALRFVRHLFLVLVMGAPLIAQTPPAIVDAPFWSRRDAVFTDNDGKEVRLEIRDRSNYTLKTFTS